VIKSAGIRLRVAVRDVPITKAARHLGLTIDQFRAKLPELYRRNFPSPDPTTGMFDLEAIDRWQDARNPQIFSQSAVDAPIDARTVAKERLARL
jgi:hypothetical protein